MKIAVALFASFLIGAGALYYLTGGQPGAYAVNGLMKDSMGEQTRGTLGSIRSALSIYYGDMEGQYPATPAALVGPRWLKELPNAQTADHRYTNAVRLVSGAEYAAGLTGDAGGWYYVTDGKSAGNFGVDCTHTDTRGKIWNGY